MVRPSPKQDMAHKGTQKCECATCHTRQRRSHTKSRAGCKNCKRRKVKCDEVHPSCGNCTRFSQLCDFIGSKPNPKLGPATAQPGPVRRPGRPRKNWTAVADADSTSQAGLQNPSKQPQSPAEPSQKILVSTASLNADDLELYHHWLVDIPKIGSTPDFHLRISRLAFRHTYLFHLMLGLSAQHLARLHPQNVARYQRLTDVHLAAGICEVTRLVSDLSTENAGAFFIATELICLSSLARRPEPGNLLFIAYNQEVPWWRLLQGVQIIIETLGFEAIYSGELGPAPSNFESFNEETSLAEKGRHSHVDWEAALDELSALVGLPESPNAKTYRHALEMLRSCFEATYGTAEHPKDASCARVEVVITWVYRTEEAFVDCLKNHEPIPLILLAYYAVPLMSVASRVWVLEGWGSHLIRSARSLLQPQYTKWLSWPVRHSEITLECH